MTNYKQHFHGKKLLVAAEPKATKVVVAALKGLGLEESHFEAIPINVGASLTAVQAEMQRRLDNARWFIVVHNNATSLNPKEYTLRGVQISKHPDSLKALKKFYVEINANLGVQSPG